MPLPTTLYNYYNQGRESLEMSSALMNPYAKWMQSPNIPRNTCLPIALETVENVIDCEPTFDEWFKNLESNKQKTHSSTPNFFPSEYKTDKFFSITHNLYLSPYSVLLVTLTCISLSFSKVKD